MGRLRMHPKVYEAAKFGNLHSQNLGDGEYLFLQTTPQDNNIPHVAAQYGQVKFIEHLLQFPSGPSFLWQGNYKWDTPLHIAAKVGSSGAVRVFTDLAKLLHWVAEKGQVDACKELLRKPNSHKDTTMHYAVNGGHDMVVKLLIEEDPQPCDITNAANESPLYLAAHQRRSDIIELILNAFPLSFSYKGPKGLTALHAIVHYTLPNWQKILEKIPEVIREGDDMGWTRLHYAACFGNVEAVRLLIQHDISVAYALDKEEESALHIAAFRGHINVIDELVRSCPDACDMINTKGQTALHAAVIGGHGKVVKHILGMPNLEDLINEQDTDGNTALHLAMLHGRSDIMGILAEERRVDRFAANKDHLTALDIYFARTEVIYTSFQIYEALKGYQGFPVIQDWAMERVKKRSDKQFFEGESTGSTTTGRNTPNREKFDSLISSIIDVERLVAPFIATVTFAAAFAMPGGYSNDGPNQGMATLAGRAAFETFVITNTIAFGSSTTALLLQLDTADLGNRAKVGSISSSETFIYIAMIAMVLAFASGSYVVSTRTIWLAIVPFVVCGFLGIFYFYSCYFDSENRLGTAIGHYRFRHGARRAYGIHQESS